MLANAYKPSLKTILRALMVCIIIGAMVVVCYFFVILKGVKISPSDGVTVTIVRRKDGAELTKTNQAKTIYVRSGDYIVTYSATEEYQSQTEILSIKSSTTIIPPHLNYTGSKLAEMLVAEKASLELTLRDVENVDNYNISEESLYIRGEWYGACLVPKSWHDQAVPSDFLPRPNNPENTLDIVKLIAKKTGSLWQVISGPAVIMNIHDSSDIPEYVIRSVNRLCLTQ